MGDLHTVRFECSKGVTSVWMPLITCQLHCVMCMLTLLLSVDTGSKGVSQSADIGPLACHHQNTVMV